MTESDVPESVPLVTKGRSPAVSPDARVAKEKPDDKPPEPTGKPDKAVSAEAESAEPPDVLRKAITSLKLGKELSVRLYSALQASNIKTYRDAKRQPMVVVAAVNTAHDLEAMRVIDALREATSDGS